VKKLLVIPLILTLSGCAMFTKTKLVPQAYMPEPPEILMRKPKDLNTIKQEEPTVPESPKSEEDY
jgi:hypothetical protein